MSRYFSQTVLFARPLFAAMLVLLFATSCSPASTGQIGDSTVLAATPVSTSLEGVTWALINFTTAEGSLPIPETFTPYLKFEDGSYVFDAGCNAVVGEYELQDGRPRIVNIAMHSVDCSADPNGTEAMALESAMADSIESWSGYRLVDNELHIGYAGGELVFSRAPSE